MRPSRAAVASLLLLAMLSSCGETDAAPRVQIVSAMVVYDGDFVFASVDVHIDAAREPTNFSWRVGALSGENLCDEGLGWRLDVLDPTGASTLVAANETRDLRLRARSRDRPACNPTQNLARCGHVVRLFVMTGDDDVLATLDTTFECLLVARTLR